MSGNCNWNSCGCGLKGDRVDNWALTPHSYYGISNLVFEDKLPQVARVWSGNYEKYHVSNIFRQQKGKR